MIRLTPDNGIPRHILLMMAIMAGFTVANLYYNQPLLDLICKDIGISHVEANFITVITQIGYALGLLFIVPLADMVSLRHIAIVCMSAAAISATAIGFAENVWMLWVASLTLGFSSIMPQLFIPMSALYSRPENKSRNMGYVASGLLTGIVSARAVSGYIGAIIHWHLSTAYAYRCQHLRIASAHPSLFTSSCHEFCQHDVYMVVYGFPSGWRTLPRQERYGRSLGILWHHRSHCSQWRRKIRSQGRHPAYVSNRRLSPVISMGISMAVGVNLYRTHHGHHSC